ncbi:ABC transporter permease [Rahnella bruchi]|uniref:ABC transporter permease n=1 Tax=Rahnella bruchi TaxID=1510573 RepID=UPI000EA39C9E|nr:ABC transporter permease [Rahnella bruchi]
MLSGQLLPGIVIAVGLAILVFYCGVNEIKFSFFNLFRHKRRSLSTIAAIMLGGTAIFLYGGFIAHSFWILKEQTIRTNLGHLQVYDREYFENTNKNKTIIGNYDWLKSALLSDEKLSPFISTISGQLEFTGIISLYENESSGYFSAIGIEPLASLKVGSFDKLISGSDLSRIKQDEITLGSGLARSLNAHYGDWLDSMVLNTQGGQGAMSMKLRGIFSSGIKEYDDVALKMPLSTAQKMMNTDGVSKMVILLKDESQLESFRSRLEQFIAQHKLPLIVKSWKELSLFYQQVEGLLSGIYFFIKLIVALVVVFMIGNAMTMNVIERTREITTLRATGVKPAKVARLFLLEGVFTGVLGAAGSLLAGFALAGVINLHGIAMPPSPGQTQGYTAFIKTDDAALIWITVLLPVLTASLASIIPAMRAARLNIADAFKFI